MTIQRNLEVAGGYGQGTIGCTPNSVPMVFIVFSRDSWGLEPIFIPT